MAISEKLINAFQGFDAANGQDPNIEAYLGKTYPKEHLYALRMTEKLHDFSPNASEALQLAVRCQHICRWHIPRESYEMNRAGYLKWRQDLKKYHVKKATEILEQTGYPQTMIDSVAFLLEKKLLKKNEETQTLEDVICLVFLEYYLEPFALKHPADKTIEILQKTWHKMSKKGHEAALQLPLSKNSKSLLTQAVDG
ncbi:MAG: DUF4202 domain-containing protein [Maribacter sp.]|nr:DUF4202 domain-containing protein [Maribacter sp.]